MWPGASGLGLFRKRAHAPSTDCNGWRPGGSGQVNSSGQAPAPRLVGGPPAARPPLGFISFNGQVTAQTAAGDSAHELEDMPLPGGRFLHMVGVEKGQENGGHRYDGGGKRRPAKSCLKKKTDVLSSFTSVGSQGSGSWGVSGDVEEGKKAVRFSMFEGAYTLHPTPYTLNLPSPRRPALRRFCHFLCLCPCRVRRRRTIALALGGWAVRSSYSYLCLCVQFQLPLPGLRAM